MAEAQGIQNTQEVMVALAAIGAKVIGIVGDGVELNDLSKLVELAKDDAFLAKIKAAREGIELVDDEIKDISFMEGAQLLMVLPALIAEVKAAKDALKPQA